MKLVVVDYGCGNLFSMLCSLRYIGADASVSADPQEVLSADRIILPGVGAFGDAADLLERSGMKEAVLAAARAGKPLLGICVGMQLLFERSYEFGVHAGLGLLPGEIRPLAGRIPDYLPVPHMGWNKLLIHRQDDPLVGQFRTDPYFYFVHSFYACRCDRYVTASADYGVSIPAVVRKGAVYGTQFHPEKSGENGLSLLRAFTSEGVRLA